MKKSVLMFSLLSGTALMFPRLTIASGLPAHTLTYTPEPKPAFQFEQPDKAFKTAGVCFLGVGDCGGAAALLLRVETVTVDGNVRYTDGEILTASGIHAGDSMLLIRKDKLLRKITALCPHVETIEIAKTYPSALTIRVTETGAVYFTQVRDRVCTLDASLRVIECTDAVDGLIELRLPEIKSAVEGSALVFADAEDDARVRTILETLGGADDVLALDCLDLRDRYNITAYAAGRAEILFGDAARLAVKLRIAREVYADALAEGSGGTRIDVSEPSRVSVSYDQVINYSKE